MPLESIKRALSVKKKREREREERSDRAACFPQQLTICPKKKKKKVILLN